MSNSPLTTHYSPRSSHAFTLVEMLIAMVLTLILVTAIAQFYAIVGDSVKDGRAMIEVGGQLRAAVERLKTDFDQITVNGVPWVDEGSASGYFEYFEGRANDYNANGNLTTGTPPLHIVDVSTAEDGDGNGKFDWLDAGATSGLGDGDDFIAFTVRSSSGIPFTGRYTCPDASTLPSGAPPIITAANPKHATKDPRIITSQLAEVVWWVGFDDVDPSGGSRYWDWSEPRQIYRRQLLICPELGQLGGTYSNPVAAHTALMWFWQYNDISARVHVQLNGGTPVYSIVANSLSDLARRENRFGHMPINLNQVTVSGSTVFEDTTFPHSAVTITSPPFLLLPSLSAKSGAGVNATNSYVLQAPYGVPGENRGEDAILSNILAFDVQVFDPYARVWQNSSGVTAITPADPGYAASVGTPSSPLGLGAFVDLNYYRGLPTGVSNTDNSLYTSNSTTYPLPYFAGVPSSSTYAKTNYATNFGFNNYPFGVTFDTWALSYERDGIVQDNPSNSSKPTVPAPPVDQGNDGVDNDSRNGVDDAAERETVPPYPQSLRGLQVKIRVYEPSTRQVRQATVATDFVTE